MDDTPDFNGNPRTDNVRSGVKIVGRASSDEAPISLPRQSQRREGTDEEVMDLTGGGAGCLAVRVVGAGAFDRGR